MKRGGYEFSKRIKNVARNKWHAEHPNREDEILEVDHIVAIWWMKKNNIPPIVGKSGQNAQALPVQEHKEKHQNETDEMYRTLAIALLGFVNMLF